MGVKHRAGTFNVLTCDSSVSKDWLLPSPHTLISITIFSVMRTKFQNKGRSIRKISMRMVLAGFLVAGQAEAQEAFESISLQAAIARALDNNYEVSIQRLNPLIQDERLKMAQAVFDVRFESSYSFQSIDTPQNAQDFVATGGGVANFSDTEFGADGTTAPATAILLEPNIYEEQNHIGRAAFIKRFSTGTSVELGSTLRVLDNSLNRQSASSLFNPEFETFSGITLTQSLLKDFGMSANLTEIKIAKSNVALAELEWQSRTAALVGEVMKRYYDVVFSYENMAIQRDAIGLAEKLLEDSRKRLAEGVAPPNDVNVAEGGVYIRKEEALIAENSYMERQNALQLLFKTVAEAGKAVSIRPVDPLLDKITIPSRAELLDYAWINRYEIRQAGEVVNQRRDQSHFAKNQVKPRLDIVASAGMHGLDGGVSESYSRAYEGQGPEWAVGFTFAVPLSFGRQKAQYRMAQHEEVQAEIDVERVKVQVSLEIDTVLSRLGTDQQRLTTARKSREVALKTLEAETLRLKEGVSTSFQVLEYQKEYAKTRSREVAALADMNKDMVDIWLTTSQLLEKRNIAIARPEPVKKVKGKSN